MRKLMNLLAVALGMFAAISCEKNNDISNNNPQKDKITLAAIINNGDTKTVLGEKGGDEYPVLWCEGDKIAVMQGNNLFEFTLQGEGGSTSGIFECTSNNATDFVPTGEIKAFYPYSAVIKGEAVQYNLTGPQEYIKESFASSASPMAAYRAENGTGALSFENLFGILKLQLKGTETVKSIGVVSTNGMALQGMPDVTIESENINASFDRSEVKSGEVVLNCPDGVTLSESATTEFLIALPAGSHTWSISIMTSDGNNSEIKRYFKTTSKVQTITAGKILKMPELSLPSDVIVETDNSYIENGVYLGEGITIDGITWAPVNCGYEAASGDYKGYPWGKLYQWGRKYGQGYSLEYDASTPVIKDGPVSLETGQNLVVSNVFYKGGDDWLTSSNGMLWNKGTSSVPIKGDYDPCPNGWRVPTPAELKSLVANKSDWTTHNGQQGYWFSGRNELSSSIAKIFFPAAGCLLFSSGQGFDRGNAGHYASNRNYYLYSSETPYLYIYIWGAQMSQAYNSQGSSVRCIREY